jgi:RNA polymerase sigma-70 factor (ECF subfamily)
MNPAAERDAVQSFEIHRRALMGLAYRMLGSHVEAEDVVQDAYLRWHAADRGAVGAPRRYLGTVVTRLCLDRLKSAQARREVYVGQWLPEPVVDEPLETDVADDLAHDLSLALMLVLERLSPLERAAFLLHDVFGLQFAEVADTLGRDEAACRQLAARARAHVEAGRPRFTSSPELGSRLAAAFRTARETGDTRALRRLLAEDAVLYTDAGGKRPAALNPIHGADKILRLLAGIARKNPALAAAEARAASINGLAGFVLREQDGSINTIAFEPCAGRIAAIYVTRNPDKLRHVRF